MIELAQRAAAIRTLISSESPTVTRQSIEDGLIACCTKLIEVGRPQEAKELALAWLARVGDKFSLRVGTMLARCHLVNEEYDECIQLIRKLIRDREHEISLFPEEGHFLRIYEGACYRGLNRGDEAIRHLLELRRELMRLPDSRAQGWCSYQLGASYVLRGDQRSGREMILDSLVSSRRAEDKYQEAFALHMLSIIERSLCRWATAHEAASDALERCKETGSTLALAHSLRSLALTSLKRGHLTTALQETDLCLETLDSSGQEHGLWIWFGTLLRGLILLHQGQYKEVRELIATNPRWQVPQARSRPSLLTTEYLGDVHLEQGQAEPALALYDEVFPKAVALVPKGDIVAELRRRRAECYYLLGRHQDAYAEAKTGLEHCRNLGDRYEEAATYRILALSAAALGRADEAKRWFDQGFAYYDDIETPYEWGKLWLAFGDWLRGPHAAEFADPAGGLEAYHAARDHFERMGAMGKLAEAEARIASATGRAASSRAATPSVRETPAPRRRPRGSSELERKSQWAFDTFGILTANKPLLRMLDDIAKLARTSSPILVLGESGTGKELVATAVHEISGRTGSFLPINCSSLPREVIESELFGHAQGAFTGAAREKAGLLEVCAGGTAFLDEIGEIPLELQSRLLRFLETGELRRVGATRNLRVDTRIVAATNREQSDLERGEGFRQDLYYRLAHAVMVLPPLRRRGDDIELLANHFLEAACVEQGKDVSLSVDALEALREHRWPGNVRELKAVMKRVVILAPGDHVVTVADLALKATDAPVTLLEELAHSEREKIARVLKQSGNSRTEAAKTLGIPRTTLLNKIRRYGLE